MKICRNIEISQARNSGGRQRKMAAEIAKENGNGGSEMAKAAGMA
jgi:hypothetical protein